MSYLHNGLGQLDPSTDWFETDSMVTGVSNAVVLAGAAFVLFMVNEMFGDDNEQGLYVIRTKKGKRAKGIYDPRTGSAYKL